MVERGKSGDKPIESSWVKNTIEKLKSVPLAGFSGEDIWLWQASIATILEPLLPYISNEKHKEKAASCLEKILRRETLEEKDIDFLEEIRQELIKILEKIN